MGHVQGRSRRWATRLGPEPAPEKAVGGSGGASRSRRRWGAARADGGEVAPLRPRAAQRGRECRAHVLPTSGSFHAHES